MAEAKRDSDEELFRTYIANSIHFMAQGKAIAHSYSDMLKNLDAPQEERTGDEIKKSIKDGLNLLRKEEKE